MKRNTLYELVEQAVAELDVLPEPKALTAVSELLLNMPAICIARLQAEGHPRQALLPHATGLALEPSLYALQLKKSVPALLDVLRAGGFAGQPPLDAFAKLGLTTVLCHLVRPCGPLSHDLPGRFGFLDDWLYLNFAAIEYAGWKPTPEEVDNIRRGAETVTSLLPAHVALGLNTVMAHSQTELATLRAQSAHHVDQVSLATERLIANPEPQPFLGLLMFGQQGRPAQTGTPADRWTFHANGGASASFKGGSYTRFADGSSVGMVGNKIIANFK